MAEINWDKGLGDRHLHEKGWTLSVLCCLAGLGCQASAQGIEGKNKVMRNPVHQFRGAYRHTSPAASNPGTMAFMSPFLGFTTSPVRTTRAMDGNSGVRDACSSGLFLPKSGQILNHWGCFAIRIDQIW